MNAKCRARSEILLHAVSVTLIKLPKTSAAVPVLVVVVAVATDPGLVVPVSVVVLELGN